MPVRVTKPGGMLPNSGHMLLEGRRLIPQRVAEAFVAGGRHDLRLTIYEYPGYDAWATWCAHVGSELELVASGAGHRFAVLLEALEFDGSPSGMRGSLTLRMQVLAATPCS